MSKESWSSDDVWRVLQNLQTQKDREAQDKARRERELQEQRDREQQALAQQKRTAELAQQQREEERQRLNQKVASQIGVILRTLYERDPEISRARYRKLRIDDPHPSLEWGKVGDNNSAAEQLIDKYYWDKDQRLAASVPEEIVRYDYFSVVFFIIRDGAEYTVVTGSPNFHDGWVMGAVRDYENDQAKLIADVRNRIDRPLHHRSVARKGKEYWNHWETDKERREREKWERKEEEYRRNHPPDTIY